MKAFIDRLPQQKNTAFKMTVSRETESKPIPCEILATEGGKSLIEYQESSGITMKWVLNEQITELD